MKFVFSPDVILCGWLGSNHQLTNYLTNIMLLLHTFVWHWYHWSFFIGHVSGLVKNFKIEIYSDTMWKFQILIHYTIYWALLVESTFSDLDQSQSKVKGQSSVKQKNCVLIQLSWNFVGLLSKLLDIEYATIFQFCTYSREIINMFSNLTKTLMLAFWQTVFKRSSKLCMIITLLEV